MRIFERHSLKYCITFFLRRFMEDVMGTGSYGGGGGKDWVNFHLLHLSSRCRYTVLRIYRIYRKYRIYRIYRYTVLMTYMKLLIVDILLYKVLLSILGLAWSLPL